MLQIEVGVDGDSRGATATTHWSAAARHAAVIDLLLSVVHVCRRGTLKLSPSIGAELERNANLRFSYVKVLPEIFSSTRPSEHPFFVRPSFRPSVRPSVRQSVLSSVLLYGLLVFFPLFSSLISLSRSSNIV